MVDIDDKLIITLSEKQIKIEMQQKGYELSTFEQFERDERQMINSNQTWACQYNLNNIKPLTTGGKYYIVRLSQSTDIRYWTVA